MSNMFSRMSNMFSRMSNMFSRMSNMFSGMSNMFSRMSNMFSIYYISFFKVVISDAITNKYTQIGITFEWLSIKQENK
jgi:hypothetical protein